MHDASSTADVEDSMGVQQRSGAAAARPWMEREAGQCAWPIGEGRGMQSCCAPVTTLASGRRAAYCARHWRRMWLPAAAAAAAGQAGR
jgi:hypothetical protein